MIDPIGIEGSSSLGQPPALALAAAWYDVREVQPNRTAERRRRRRRVKTDIEVQARRPEGSVACPDCDAPTARVHG